MEDVIKKVHERGEIYMELDGFYVWEPRRYGFLGPHHLRAIADELDRMNAPWEAQIEDYFNKEKAEETCKA